LESSDTNTPTPASELFHEDSYFERKPEAPISPPHHAFKVKSLLDRKKPRSEAFQENETNRLYSLTCNTLGLFNLSNYNI
jgi:hypothetical protein